MTKYIVNQIARWFDVAIVRHNSTDLFSFNANACFTCLQYDACLDINVKLSQEKIFLNKFYSFNFECCLAKDHSRCQKSTATGSSLFICIWYISEAICASYFYLTDDFKQVKSATALISSLFNAGFICKYTFSPKCSSYRACMVFSQVNFI